MDSKEILRFCLEKGILLDKDILDLFNGIEDTETAKLVLDRIKEYTHTNILTRHVIDKNRDKVSEIILNLPKNNQKCIEELTIRLGLSIHISKKVLHVSEISEEEKKLSDFESVKIISSVPITNKKIEIKDFVTHFRNRFNNIRNILQEHSELNNLVSINKISGNRQGVSVIGIVSEKRVTKNNNILLDIEDLTGKIRVLINQNKPELYKKAQEIIEDTIVGFKGSGNREILFVNDIIFPEANLTERKKSPVEEYALFTGDLHIGSEKFMEKNFLKFIDYLNGKVPNTPEVEKIKYLFLIGDLIAGVGVYPGQEKELKIQDIESQFEKAAELLSKIRSDIKIIISPGNHDGLRMMEPQPLLDEKYAWSLYNMKNVILTQNPATINIGGKKGFSGFDVLAYHGYSYHYYANNVEPLMKERAIHKPELIMAYLLKHRHLAPTHSSTLYYPYEEDPLLIKKIPDILLSGHTHKSTISYYNNILVISSSTWESLTPFQEKMGNEPDFCKVPMFNLKTRAIKILDFE